MPTPLTDGHGRSTGLVDVLDRVLDKGIVIDALVRLAIVGIDLVTIEARIVVASIETYLDFAASLSAHSPRQLTLNTQTARGVTSARPARRPRRG